MWRFNQWFVHSPLLPFMAFLGLIAALKWTAIGNPPTWDEACSVFSAADYLSRHHFDVAGMLREPNCGSHWLSLMSLTSALAMWALGGGKATWAVLHVLQWVMGAVLGVTILRLLEPLAGRRLAWLAALLLVVTPVTLAQLGCMYLEIPLVMFSVMAVKAHMDKRSGLAALWCFLACFSKEPGLLIATALGVTAILLAARWQDGVKTAACYLVPGLLLVFFSGVMVAGAGAEQSADGLTERCAQFWELQVRAVDLLTRFTPDHAVMLLLSLMLSMLMLLKLGRIRWRQGVAGLAEPEVRLALIAALMLAGFLLFFFGLMPLVWQFPNYLPRYMILSLPFLLVVCLFIVRDMVDRRIQAGMLIVLTVLCLLNRHGALYGERVPSNISIGERSEEYVDGYAMTRNCLAAVERDVPPEAPVLFCGLTHLLTQNPAFGYVSKTQSNAVNVMDPVRAERYLSGVQADLPDRFFLVYDYFGLGGRKIKLLLSQLSADGSTFEIRQHRTFSHGSSTTHLFEVARKK